MAPNNLVEKIADALHIPGVHKRGDGAEAAPAAEGETKKPIFEKEKVTVIFVLGGPGAGVSLSFSHSFLFSFVLSLSSTRCANSSSSTAYFI